MQEFQISAILDKESIDKLNKLANDNDRTISAQLRVMIKEFKE